MLLHEKQHAMDGLPFIPHVLWVHDQGFRSHKPGTQLIHCDPVQPSLRAPKLLGQRIWRELQKHQAIPRVVYIGRRKTTCHGCTITHFTWLVGVCTRYDKRGMQSIHWNPLLVLFCHLLWVHYHLFPSMAHAHDTNETPLPATVLWCSSHCSFLNRKLMAPLSPQYIQTLLTQNALSTELK